MSTPTPSEDVRSALVVAAHPGDLDRDGAETARIREAEQRAQVAAVQPAHRAWTVRELWPGDTT